MCYVTTRVTHSQVWPSSYVWHDSYTFWHEYMCDVTTRVTFDSFDVMSHEWVKSHTCSDVCIFACLTWFVCVTWLICIFDMTMCMMSLYVWGLQLPDGPVKSVSLPPWMRNKWVMSRDDGIKISGAHWTVAWLSHVYHSYDYVISWLSLMPWLIHMSNQWRTHISSDMDGMPLYI